ncbi:MAG TPA: STAS domain-containing protein [Mycobacteriales bacterium]|jgi:anti-anti-sigma factor|nr:STAS domain-containing protein [Mycobacteriales bacterium]
MNLKLKPDGDGRSVLHVSGEIDLQVADELRDAGIAAASNDGVAVDLSQVSFIDSSGLAALIEINNATQDAGRQLTLVKPSRTVRRILEITGLHPAFVVVD